MVGPNGQESRNAHVHFHEQDLPFALRLGMPLLLFPPLVGEIIEEIEQDDLAVMVYLVSDPETSQDVYELVSRNEYHGACKDHAPQPAISTHWTIGDPAVKTIQASFFERCDELEKRLEKNRFPLTTANETKETFAAIKADFPTNSSFIP